MTTCTCGNTKDHSIARRATADGTRVLLWCDGAVSGALGFKLPSVPMVRPTSPAAVSVALAAGWLLLGEVELYDLAEVPALYAACRKAAARNRSPDDVREKLHAPAALKPSWTIYQADRDGRPTARVWRLPRLRWPGLAVWDHCAGGRGGRYEIVSYDRTDVAKTTGVRCENLAEVREYLEAAAAVAANAATEPNTFEGTSK